MVFNWLFKKSGYGKIFKYFPDPVIVFNEQFIIQTANLKALKLFGLSLKEIKQKRIDELLEFDDAFDDKETIIAQYKNEGVQKVFKISISNTLEIRDNPRKIIFSLRDISEEYATMNILKKNQESSALVNRDKNNFLVKIADELNSPLYSIIGFSQTLLEKVAGDLTEKQLKYLNIIHKNSSDLMDLIEKIVNLSKAEGGLYKFEYNKFDFIELVKKVIESKKDVIATKQIELTLDYETFEKRNCNTDENAVKLILSNLMDISFQNIDTGLVKLQLKSPEVDMVEKLGLPMTGTLTTKSYLLCNLTDFGKGYTRQDLELLCDPYLQLDKQNTKSLSMALSIVVTKYLVEKIGGLMWIESNVGVGTTLSFIIPIER